MCQREYLYYTDAETVYSDAGQVSFDSFSNGWVIKNTGTTLLIIDGKETLQPTESKSFGGNVGEIYVGQKRISFKTQAIPPAVITNQATVTEKIYVKRSF
jgi:hypothetical protein